MRKTAAFLTLILCIFLAGCFPASDIQSTTPASASGPAEASVPDNGGIVKNPQVTITMEDGGKIVVELYPDVAPNTVNNFIYIVEQGLLDGSMFHRVSPSFMIQGGMPADGKELGYTIKGEFSSNGFENNLTHKKGVISMARTTIKDSATTQFFLMTADSKSLDGDYAGFGMVIDGQDVVDRIGAAEWQAAYGDNITGKPAVDQVMASVTVDTFGVDYPEPEKLK